MSASMSHEPSEREGGNPHCNSSISVSKTFPGVRAVQRVNLSVKKGEFLTLLGPSGSGKTTTLRMIAGFADPSEGAIYAHGSEISTRPPTNGTSPLFSRTMPSFATRPQRKTSRFHL